ncbi:MAG: rhodanese-like domain-containing protein [Flavobacteriales bacterium]|nr:rhodanese-like domain-containing protein [Flavobacteriales bacterium]
MNKHLLYLCALTTMGFSQILWGQEQVTSRSYQAMLNTMLSHSVEEIAVDSLKDRLGDFTFLDAREEKEFAVSHLPAAIHVGYEAFDSTQVASLDRDTPLVVYCSIGYRSEKIAERLMDMGFSEVYNLYGGIFEWVNQGNEVINTGQATDSVHAYSKLWGIWLKSGVKVYD